MQHDLIEYQIMIEKKIEKDNKKKSKASKKEKKEKKDKKDKEKKKKKKKDKKDKIQEQPDELEPPASIHSSVDGRIIRWSKR